MPALEPIYLPPFLEVAEKRDMDGAESLTALEAFIWEFEPSHPREEKLFRERLQALVDYVAVGGR